MSEFTMSRCPICEQTNLVEINECLVRSTDEVLCINENYQHLKRGHIHLLVHTKENLLAEKEEPEISMQMVLN